MNKEEYIINPKNMTTCGFCHKEGDENEMFYCKRCAKPFHNKVQCVNTRLIKLTKKEQCPLCGSETEAYNERICPFCGEHLWFFHIECGGIFQKNPFSASGFAKASNDKKATKDK